MNIHFVSAGAGTGKTRRVTEEIRDRVLGANGTSRVRPGAIIAVTFTNKAAEELVDRARSLLFKAGKPAAAIEMSQALVGTVNGVSGRILQRYAFEAGLSPRLEVLPEEEAAGLFSQAMERAAEGDDIAELQELAEILGAGNPRRGTTGWKEHVGDIARMARANNLGTAGFDGMAERSCRELLQHFPTVSLDGDETDRLLLSALGEVPTLVDRSDSTQATAKYLERVEKARRLLEHDRLPWGEWVWLAKGAPGSKSKAAGEMVREAARDYAAHPRLHQHIQDYARKVFGLAARVLDSYQQSKGLRGLIDFTDQELLAHRLLEGNPGVVEDLRGRLDLLVVDEFQDTSPIQLALFLGLAAIAKETLWVGDVKQAIYGFRGSDPELMNAVVAHLRAAGSLAAPLRTSYRSRSDLVRLVNALFGPAFGQAFGLTDGQVRSEVELDAHRPADEEGAALHLAMLGSGIPKKDGGEKSLTNGQYVSALAGTVRRFIDEGTHVAPKGGDGSRPVRHGDIAVLCRQNATAALVAGELAAWGVPVSLGGPGLLATPEARLALACLRRLQDPHDNLATAEVLALGGSRKPESWIEERLQQLASEPSGGAWGLAHPTGDPLIRALHAAGASDRLGHRVLTPSEALDLALRVADIAGVVGAWDVAEDRAIHRRHFVEALRGLATDYEDQCAVRKSPATVAGLLAWLTERAAVGTDKQAGDEEADAVRVLTYHAAKGLDWPVVFCAELGEEPRTRLWDALVVKEVPDLPFSVENPLGNRWVRFWPWPFGLQSSGIEVATHVEGSPEGQEALRMARAEELRLLYVGLTRARDILVLVLERGQQHSWLDAAEAGWFRPTADSLQIEFPDGGAAIACRVWKSTPADPAALGANAMESTWFPAREEEIARVPARVVSSCEKRREGARAADVLPLGDAIGMPAGADSTVVGDALHSVFARSFIEPLCGECVSAAEEILRRHGLAEGLAATDVIACADRLRAWVDSALQPTERLVEWPFIHHLDDGRVAIGWIDLLLKTPEGWVIVDHKTFSGPTVNCTSKAIEYSGQLALYTEAVLKATGQPVVAAWIHFPINGVLVRVEWPSPVFMPRIFS